MERKAYSVDKSLFYLLLEEDFDKLNTDELQRLFDNSSYGISDKWVLISDKTERGYQKESENQRIEHFFYATGLYGYKYFSLIDYGNNSTYKIGVPDVSRSDDVRDRQKSVTIDERNVSSESVTEIKKYVFNRLASGTQIDNYLVNNIKQILIKSFTDFFHDEFGKIQNRVEQNMSPTDHKNPFFVTYNVDPKQFQEHKNVVAEKLYILKDIVDMNIKETFFKPYTNTKIIALINMQTRTMDLIRTINEYIRANASLYLEWKSDTPYDELRYDTFDSQILSEYKTQKIDQENIKNVKELILNEFRNFSDNWYDNESFVLSSKKKFHFRIRQRTDKICNSLGDFILLIYNNTLKLGFKKLHERYNKISSYIRRNTWIQIAIGYTLLSIFSGFCQAIFQKYIK